MFGNLFGGLGAAGYFEKNYRCYPVAFIEKETAEKGDKVILPPSALETLGTISLDGRSDGNDGADRRHG